jgi:hypothetical protein
MTGEKDMENITTTTLLFCKNRYYLASTSSNNEQGNIGGDYICGWYARRGGIEEG